MDPKVYRAAAEGSWDKLKSEPWRDQLTPVGNAVLHVHLGRPLKIGNTNIDFIKKVLDQETQLGMRSDLLWHKNANGELPLHLAARCGHLEAVGELLARAKMVNEEEAKRMLRETNNRKDTALHEAARGGFCGIVKLLIEADPSCPHEANEAKETPLYLAAERRCASCVVSILDNCAPSALAYGHKGPCGRTPLHVLIQWELPEISQILLNKDGLLIGIQDDEGSTPLHLAAGENKIEHLQVLLRYDEDANESAAYITDNHGRTPLHVATLSSDLDSMKELINHRPDCIEISDNRGQNMLHYAAKWGCVSKIQHVLQHENNASKLWNEKDLEGNTPLHILATELPYIGCGCFLKALNFIKCQQEYLNSFNNENFSAADIVQSHFDEKRLSTTLHTDLCGQLNGVMSTPRRITKGAKVETRETLVDLYNDYKDYAKRFSATQIVVAALVATVSFTAGFTVPGGFDQNQGPNIGTAVMTKKAAFKAFLVSDAIALAFSGSAVFLYFTIAKAALARPIVIFSHIANGLSRTSIAAMMVAFVTGVYAVVPQSPSLQIALVFIFAVFFFFFVFYFLYVPFINRKLRRVHARGNQGRTVATVSQYGGYILSWPQFILTYCRIWCSVQPVKPIYRVV